MNKQALKSYMNKAQKGELKSNCYRVFKNTFEKGYIISDTFSIIVLNDNYNLPIQDFDKFGLEKMLDHFNNDFKTSYTFDTFDENEKEYVPIDENLGINVKLYNKINKIIKRDTLINVLENTNKNDYLKYIIKIENTKTTEYAYMLPMREF